MSERCDVAIVGAGAAGLFAAIWAARTARGAGRPLRVVALDGARRVGAKVLVAGGGRCNVTHWQVSERDYAGSTPPAIRKVLRAFGVDRTQAFFAELGVQLKREETGKLFPTTDDAHTVLDALLGALRDAGAELRSESRVHGIALADTGLAVQGDWGELHASRVILATGGKALPKSGSDGAGFAMATALGHTLTQPITPALVPLVLADGHWLRGLAGVALPARLQLCSGTGKRLAHAEGSTLCTHFGLSGPAVLDISRHLLAARHADAGARLEACWLPGETQETLDEWLLAATGRGVGTMLRERLPERMVRAVCEAAQVAPVSTVQQMPREARRRLVALLSACPLPVVGDRGYTFAEATAGGVPLSELRLDTMESRVQPGLHLAGELCDVDGRIGGFNFQWAWASGYLAGCAAAAACAS